MFGSTYNRGFHMTFANGITISVQFGHGNYCERNEFNPNVNADMENDATQSKNAEVAVWRGDMEWVTKEAYSDTFGESLSDDVEGYETPERVAELISWCVKQNPY